ncbi:MAG: type 2 lanthipeptide synthetase LanM family protein [Kofleriaceae bacterium]
MVQEYLSAFGEHLYAALSVEERARVAEPPDWILRLQKLYVTHRPPEGDPEFLRHVEGGTRGFSWLVSPLFHDTLQRFRDGVARIATGSTPFAAHTLERLVVPSLLQTLREALDLVMVLELNVARVQGVLSGDTPEARFRAFCESLRRPETQASIAREYPVLMRCLYTRATNWLDATLELLERLAGDWDEISARLAEAASPGQLASIQLGAGDRHRRGRTVAILEFESGWKLVYKPRSMAVDRHFAELLRWVNEAGFETPFRLPALIDRVDYGWSQFAAHTSCSTRDEVERFYQRLGGYLAVFYVVRGTDMHHENLLAAGEHPVPVDLETLFHPDALGERDDPAIEAYRHSVMPVLLLPEGTDEREIDVSSFGAKSGQRFPPGRTFSWDKPGTDEMRVRHDVTGAIMATRNRPRIADQEVVAEDYLEPFLVGFRGVYRLIAERRAEATAMLDRFAHDEVRFIARPTAAYAGLLRPCYQPDRLGDAADRDRVFDDLHLAVVRQPSLARLIPFEVDDLRGGDVPVFTSRPASRDLWSSDGTRIPAYFERTAIELVHEGLGRLGETDLARQEMFIRTAIASTIQARAPRTLPLTRGRSAVDLARAVGDLLCADALENEAHASWLCATRPGEALSPLHPGLYEGLSGCALFLAYLGAVTGDISYRRIARKSIALVRRHLERGPAHGPRLDVGGFTGLGGIVYTLTHLAVLWNDPSLVVEAKTIAGLIPASIDDDRALDVISGSAGAIAALAVLNRVSPADELLRIASLCGTHLVEHQQLQDVGAAWTTSVTSTRPLTGFSHGAAGMAWALQKLAAWTGETRFRTAAERAIAYERSTYVEDAGNWPDFRAWPAAFPRPDFQVAWCHGAPGIGLARLDNLSIVDDRETLDEIRAALHTTVGGDVGANHCLCHGDLGNLDIVLHAAQRGDDFWWTEFAKERADKTIAAIAEHGVICSHQSCIAPPGLMTGLAGIGYGLLRIASPERVPSVLVLAPPPGW